MPVECQEKKDKNFCLSSTSSHVSVQHAQGMFVVNENFSPAILFIKI